MLSFHGQLNVALGLLSRPVFLGHAWVNLVSGAFINERMVRNQILPYQPFAGLNL